MKPATRQKALLATEKAISEIHRDPSEPNTLDHLANIVGISPNRFHKLFRAIVGEPVGAYVQRARMEFAVKMLRASPDMSLTEAAHASGHAELSHFSKAFKSFYGMTPNEWNRKTTLKNNKNCQAGKFGNIYEWDCLPEWPMSKQEKVFIKTFPKMRLAVYRVSEPTVESNLSKAFDKLEDWLMKKSQVKNDAWFMGMTYSDLLSAGPDTHTFDLAYPIDSGTKPSEDIVIRDLPPFIAAVTHCKGGLPDFVSAWDRLHRDWLPNSPYQSSSLPTMEMYFNDPRESNMEFWDMDCILPVQ